MVGKRFENGSWIEELRLSHRNVVIILMKLNFFTLITFLCRKHILSRVVIYSTKTYCCRLSKSDTNKLIYGNIEQLLYNSCKLLSEIFRVFQKEIWVLLILSLFFVVTINSIGSKSLGMFFKIFMDYFALLIGQSKNSLNFFLIK
jgi:hypothetical protein